MALVGIGKSGFDDLLQHYQDGGLDAVLLEKDSPETIGKKRAFKIGGRDFDLVILKLFRGAKKGGHSAELLAITKSKSKSYWVYRFHHIVRGLGSRNGEDLKAKAKPKWKGLRKKELLDVHWEGGKLASVLNGDADLKAMILKNKTAPLKVEADPKNDVLRIIHEKKLFVVEERSGFMKKTTKAVGFPPVEALDAIDKIAQHARAI